MSLPGVQHSAVHCTLRCSAEPYIAAWGAAKGTALLPEVHYCVVHYSPGCSMALVQWCQPTWGPPSAPGLFLGHPGTHQHLIPSEPLQDPAAVPQRLQRGQEPLHMWLGGQAGTSVPATCTPKQRGQIFCS